MSAWFEPFRETSAAVAAGDGPQVTVADPFTGGGEVAVRLLLGAAWLGESDFVMTEPDGSAIHPQVLSRRFTAQAKSAGLPLIRFHDVRHSYATAALAAGVPVKVLSQRLGHADIGVTLRIYAHVMPGDDEAAAALAANAIFGIP